MLACKTLFGGERGETRGDGRILAHWQHGLGMSRRRWSVNPKPRCLPRCKCLLSRALERRCGKWSFSAGPARPIPAGCRTGALSQHGCLSVTRLQGGISSLTQHLLLPGVHVVTTWRGSLAGEMSAWDPSREEMLCMTEMFGGTVTSPVPGCLLAPGSAKRLLLREPTAVWGGCRNSKRDGFGP